MFQGADGVFKVISKDKWLHWILVGEEVQMALDVFMLFVYNLVDFNMFAWL